MAKASAGHTTEMTTERLRQIGAFWRASNYIGAAQLYLLDNPLLREPLKPEHIKPRLLGHWGTQPGLNLIYAHLNRLIRDTGANVLLIVGPGHGAPAILAGLYLEGTLTEYYPDISLDVKGLKELMREFSWPYGMPSHLFPGTPGMIHEGGELGYSLAHAFGAVLDNPNLICACVVGDGEAETGPLAASWHSNKFLDPAGSGAVLPILHLNGYKLSGPAFLARLSDDELTSLFTGHGYAVRIVAGDDPAAVHPAMWQALDWAYGEIRRIQGDARRKRCQTPFARRPEGCFAQKVSDTFFFAWPMIILRTPKGWTGPKSVDGAPVEGTFHAHQVPLMDVKTNPAHLKEIEAWLRSYRPEELFDSSGRAVREVTAVCPRGDLRIGKCPQANGGQLLVPLKLPDYTRYEVKVSSPGAADAEATKELAKFIRDVFRMNADRKNFRFFCPDETTSNRMQHIFEVTGRAFEWPLVATDEFMARDGRVMEVLSEHLCEGWLEGYLLTGRHGLFACYEAFIPIVDSMLNQYAKWIKVCREIPWRKPVASLNYLLTSHVWRQDHNGYTHQVPSFINNLVNKKGSVSRIYLPPDANCLLSVADHCLRSVNYVNLIVASKQLHPAWLDMKSAQEHCAKGASVWKWASSDDGREPDVVLAAAGDVPTTEILAAAWLLRQEGCGLKVRVVNVVDLFSMVSKQDHPHGLDDSQFADIFTADKPVVFAFHGYPGVIHELVHHRPDPGRFHVRGYVEEGRTTTPFDMLVLNHMSRYDLAIAAVKWAIGPGPKAASLTGTFASRLEAHRKYICENDEDMPEVVEWRWGR